MTTEHVARLDALLAALDAQLEPTRDELKQALTDLLVNCSCEFNDCEYHHRARNLLGLSHNPEIAQRHVAQRQAAGAVGRAEPPDGWQDIETAPKDGRRVLVWNGFDVRTAQCFEVEAGIYEWHGVRAAMPTHWMPLPAPPVTERRKEER